MSTLTTLLLSNNYLEEIAGSFFVHLPNLQILDLSNNPIVSLPDSLSNLQNLTSLLLSFCTKLKNVPSLSMLKALKKLDLKGTRINEIPQGLKMLVNLRYLNLGFTRHLREIPNGLLSKLCHLEYLAVHPVPTRVVEMRELNKFEFFGGRFSNVRDLSMFDGQRKKVHNYSIWVGQLVNYMSDLYDFFNYVRYSKRVKFVRIDINSGCGVIVPYDIQLLNVRDCIGMRSVNDISGLKDITSLKECAIRGVDELESVFSLKCPQLETLEFLKLQFLKSLKAIIGESSIGTLSSLKKIHLSHCDKIKNVLSGKWVLHNLDNITVGFCDEVEQIIESEEDGMGTNNIKYTLPKLRKLKLHSRPKLRRICSPNGVMVCDSLQSMELIYCRKLKLVPLYLGPLLDKENPSPPPLEEIRVDSKKQWKSLEWSHPKAKNVLLPFLNISVGKSKSVQLDDYFSYGLGFDIL